MSDQNTQPATATWEMNMLKETKFTWQRHQFVCQVSLSLLLFLCPNSWSFTQKTNFIFEQLAQNRQSYNGQFGRISDIWAVSLKQTSSKSTNIYKHLRFHLIKQFWINCDSSDSIRGSDFYLHKKNQREYTLFGAGNFCVRRTQTGVCIGAIARKCHFEFSTPCLCLLTRPS